MSSITFKAPGKKGGYVKASAIPANHSARSHFGALDAAIVTVFLLAIGGLVAFLLLK